MSERVLEVSREAEAAFWAECLAEVIFTQADSWEELRSKAREAVAAFVGHQGEPTAISLHLACEGLAPG